MYKLRVLLADSHESFRRTLSSFLKAQRGVKIVGEASNGREVVEKAEHLHPDLILMDIHMPEQSGIEAAKVIKSRLPLTRVFILSMDISDVCQKNVHEFADGFIPKSSIKNALLSVLSLERQLHNETIAANAAAA